MEGIGCIAAIFVGIAVWLGIATGTKRHIPKPPANASIQEQQLYELRELRAEQERENNINALNRLGGGGGCILPILGIAVLVWLAFS